MDICLKEAIIHGKMGDREAYIQIYNLTNQMVYYTALKFTGNENDAQDLVQETYIKVFQNIGSLQEENAFLSWLKTIITNLCKDQLRKRNTVIFDNSEEQEQVIENTPEIGDDFLPEEYVLKKEKSRLVMKIIDSLPDLQRTTVLLYYYNDLSVGEVAAIMEASEGTVKSRLNYARQFIKKEVEKLEKKDIKLYSVSAIPILSLILHNDAAECLLPKAASQSILSHALNTGIKTLRSTSVLPHFAPLGNRLMAASVATKVITGVVTIGIVIGGIVSLSIGTQNIQQQKPQYIMENSQLGQTLSIPDNLEQYLGKSLDVLSKAVGGEPKINNSNKNEDGNINSQSLYYECGNVFLNVDLEADAALLIIKKDTTLSISNISIDLLYDKIAGIEKNDDMDTVRKKLAKAGVEYNDTGHSINFDSGIYSYSIYGLFDVNRAEYIGMSLSQNEKYRETQFNRYCELFSGGFYLRNGDYIVITEAGLTQFSRNWNSILKTWDPNNLNGTLEKINEELIYTSEDGNSRSLINQNGYLMLIQDAVPLITSNVPTSAPAEDPLLVKYKQAVRIYQDYAYDKFGNNSKLVYYVADFTHDGIPELYTIHNMSSPGRYSSAELHIYTIKNNEVVFLASFVVSEPTFEGGTEFTNYYISSIPGVGSYIVADDVFTRMGSGHDIHVYYFDQDRNVIDVDSVDFSYANTDLDNGSVISDYPRAQELLLKYNVNYNNIVIGLDPEYRLYFGLTFSEGGDSDAYLQYLLSGEKDSEILFMLTGQWPD